MQTYILLKQKNYYEKAKKTLANESTSCLSVNDLIRLNARINWKKNTHIHSLM